MRDRSEYDLSDLLNPALAFNHPQEVVDDPDLTTAEKRAILASWASDACAVEAMPDLRHASSGKAVPFDDICDALRQLDRKRSAGADRAAKQARRQRVYQSLDLDAEGDLDAGVGR